VRGHAAKGTFELMHDLGIIHCTDISKELPSTDSNVLYTRLFGHGKHNLYQFDDTELLDIDMKIRNKNLENTYLTFHGAKMYTDAARLKVYEKKGTFPNVTKTKGLESLKSVLEEDSKFPATKGELIEKQGWKVFDLSDTEHRHASVLLEKLPDRKYGSPEEVIGDLE
jgi:hypothetical protein